MSKLFELFEKPLSVILREHNVTGPVCHVGSKDRNLSEEDAKARKQLFLGIKNPDLVGVDIEPGVNVDLVADLCADDFLETNAHLKGHFGFVFCSALLEHVQDPFKTAKNIEGLLKPGGTLYYTGPWVWGYHPYPDDYWRFSFSAVKLLFPSVEWDDWWYGSTKKNQCIKINNIRNERKVFAEVGPNLLNEGEKITDRAMPYLNVCAIGRKG